MNLLDARSKLAAVLAPVADTDPAVLMEYVDSLHPPALMLGWGEPALEPSTPCLYYGRLIVTCVAARTMPGPGQSVLETLWEYVLTRIATDADPWPLEQITGARQLLIGNVTYLASDLTLRLPVSLGGT